MSSSDDVDRMSLGTWTIGGWPPFAGTDAADDLLRCREQALHSAAMMCDGYTQFPEDDAEKVIAIAKRFERFMRSGE